MGKQNEKLLKNMNKLKKYKSLKDLFDDMKTDAIKRIDLTDPNKNQYGYGVMETLKRIKDFIKENNIILKQKMK
tara:strand:+ start:535 stop:756 length:222 start_codon:yes stop_codon:yes gene_type:complete